MSGFWWTTGLSAVCGRERTTNREEEEEEGRVCSRDRSAQRDKAGRLRLAETDAKENGEKIRHGKPRLSDVCSLSVRRYRGTGVDNMRKDGGGCQRMSDRQEAY